MGRCIRPRSPPVRSSGRRTRHLWTSGSWRFTSTTTRNSRWLVFASKADSPYTELYLTHIDDAGSSTPPVLAEVTQRDARQPRANYLTALALAAQAKPDDALRHLAVATEQQPDLDASPDLHSMLAASLSRQLDDYRRQVNGGR